MVRRETHEQPQLIPNYPRMTPIEHFATRPDPADYAPFTGAYVSEVPEGDVVELLRQQIASMSDLFGGMTDRQASFRYADDKWSLKQLIGHLTDMERVFVYRALRIARGDTTPTVGFDSDGFAARSNSDERSLVDLLSEFVLNRKSTIAFFSTLGHPAWELKGTTNGFNYSVRAIAFVIAGHNEHHLKVIQTRYIPNLPA